MALNGVSVLITGPSGSGKSGLALSLMAFGCQLVSDDQVLITRSGKTVTTAAPETLRGLIEARGIGVLNAAATGDPVPLGVVVDMSQTESERLPPFRQTRVLGHTLPLLRKLETPHFAAAVLQFLKAGRNDAI